MLVFPLFSFLLADGDINVLAVLITLLSSLQPFSNNSFKRLSRMSRNDAASGTTFVKKGRLARL